MHSACIGTNRPTEAFEVERTPLHVELVGPSLTVPVSLQSRQHTRPGMAIDISFIDDVKYVSESLLK